MLHYYPHTGACLLDNSKKVIPYTRLENQRWCGRLNIRSQQIQLTKILDFRCAVPPLSTSIMRALDLALHSTINMEHLDLPEAIGILPYMVSRSQLGAARAQTSLFNPFLLPRYTCSVPGITIGKNMVWRGAHRSRASSPLDTWEYAANFEAWLALQWLEPESNGFPAQTRILN
ncbi:hypothetical protein B0H17DRAFT_1140328 [Mycena rosella]|uniref:Uncharacterized protein n=1 Tax=Mycena rosella TaxID=1033263 RepID=A0AAD7D2N0_MYCRO|nr:hypothetical protein B0H17DRAFT_1140328 [Mycena rosella]